MTAISTIDVLIPTYTRACALAVTLTSLAAQDFREFKVIISDQSDPPGVLGSAEVRAVLRFLEAEGIDVRLETHLPRRGMAEQRAYLLSLATAPYCLFLDDDVLLKNDLLGRLHRSIIKERCGFVGSALHGLSYIAEERPHQQEIDFWDGPVVPEEVVPGGEAWPRHHLHSAANLFHVQNRMLANEPAGAADPTRHYRVAWIGGCVLFDTGKLREAGGFDFWTELPDAHCGEDVHAQLRVMARFGGCGIFPSGAFHMELPTTISTREVDAPRALFK